MKQKISEYIFLLALIGFLVYLPSLFGGFIWDDEDFVTQNQYVQNFQVDQFFTHQIEAGRGKVTNYYRPLQLVLYSTIHTLVGFNPFFYHLANVILHIMATCLVFLFFYYLSRQYFGSFILALIFLIHPVQTESVSYISGVSDSLFTIFGFASLIVLLRQPKYWLWWSSLLFLLCLLSKETGLIFGGLIIAWWLIFTNRRTLVTLVPFGLLTSAYLIFHQVFVNQQNVKGTWMLTNPTYATHIVVRLATFIQNLFTYAQIILFPKDLFMERDATIRNATTLWNWHILLFLSINIVIAFALIKFRQKIHQWPIVVFCYLGFFISFIPYSGLALINGIFYEHYLYVPLIFFGGFFIYLFDLKQTKPIMIIVTVISVLFVIRSWARQYEWIDPIRFYTQTLVRAPGSLRVHTNLGIAYADQGDLINAAKQYRQSILIDPKIPNAYHNLANVYVAQGNLKQAENYYLKAIQVDPHFYFSYLALIRLYEQTNQKQKLTQMMALTDHTFPHLLRP